MKLAELGIFGRTFLLITAALLSAVGIGTALLITRPPMHNAPVRLSEIARQLPDSPQRPSAEHGVPGRGPPGPPPEGFARDMPPPRDRPQSPPPSRRSAAARGLRRRMAYGFRHVACDAQPR